MGEITLEKKEIDILISSLMLLTKTDEEKLEEQYKIKINRLFNKLYTLETMSK